MLVVMGQKAPSAIRCIKTAHHPFHEAERQARQKAPSAIRCIKTSLLCSPGIVAHFPVRKHLAP